MRIALIAATLLIPLSEAASLTGSVVDQTGASIAHATVELDSGARKYRAQTDDAGGYQFASLPAGQYALTARAAFFSARAIMSIELADGEQKRIPEIPLDRACGGFRDLVLLPPGDSFGGLSGSVLPPMADVEVTLLCRTFIACASTKTDANGRFSFDMISAGVYGLNFRHEGFYPEIATGYEYMVNAGWESVYTPANLERCPNGNCDPKLRSKRPIALCE